MMREDILQMILDNKVIAIVRGLNPDQCVHLAHALHQGGIKLIEVTFDQTSKDDFIETTQAIQLIRQELGSAVSVGAGTVLTCHQVDLAKAAGAEYIITPEVDEEVIRYTKEQGLVILPGALTPTEIMQAWNAGADMVKVFPSGNLGASYIKAIKAPLKQVPLLAVGGVNEKNAVDFIRAGALGVGVGCLVNNTWISNGEYEKITALAHELIENVMHA